VKSVECGFACLQAHVQGERAEKAGNAAGRFTKGFIKGVGR